MRIKIFAFLLLLPIICNSQDIKLKVSTPIENHYGQILGDQETGFIKVFLSGNDIIIYALDKDKMTYIGEELYKGLVYKTMRHGFRIINNDIFLFYQKVESMITQEDLYYAKINTSNAKMEEEKLLISTLDFDKNEKYGWFKYDIKVDTDKFYIKSYANKAIVNLRVYDNNNFDKVWEKNIEIEKDHLDYETSDFYFNENKEEFYLYASKIIKAKSKGLDDEIFHGLFIVKDNLDYKLNNIDFDGKIISSAILVPLNNNDLSLQGIANNKKSKEFSVFSLNLSEKNEIIDESVIEFTLHPSMDKSRYESGMRLYTFLYGYDKLNDNSNVHCHSMSIGLQYSIFRFYVVSKFSADGKIIFSKDFAVSGSYNILYNKFLFSANDNKVNIVLLDELKKVVLKGKEYNGNYIKAYSIGNKGELLSSKVFNGENFKDYKFKYAFRDGIVKKMNTFSCHVSIKKKEDLVFEVNFED